MIIEIPRGKRIDEKNDELKNDDLFRKMKHDRKNMRKLFVK